MLANCFMILANLFYKWYKCLRMLANTIADLTNVLQMKREHDAWVTNCLIHIAGVSLCLISASLQSAYFPSNLYTRLTTATNALPTIRMA